MIEISNMKKKEEMMWINKLIILKQSIRMNLTS